MPREQHVTHRHAGACRCLAARRQQHLAYDPDCDGDVPGMDADELFTENAWAGAEKLADDVVEQNGAEIEDHGVANVAPQRG